MAYVLGIDVGTQSTKVLIYDRKAKKVIAREQADYDLISADDGTREQEASWWTDAIQACLAKIEPSVKMQIDAIGVSGQQHGFVPLDKDGKVLRAVKLWCDTSTTVECGELTRAYGGEKALLDGPGNLILPGYTLPKILWLKKHEPSAYLRLAKILLPHDYVNFWLTGAYSMEFGDASGTGFLNIRTRKWDFKLLNLVDADRDWKDCLPDLLEAPTPAGRLTGVRARELGIPEGTLVASGGGDNMMAAIGTGNVAAGTVTLSLGTSGTLYAYSDEPIVDSDGLLAAFCSSTGGWLPLLCTMNCTVATEISRNLLETDLSTLNALAEKAPAGSKGVVMLPFFNGERSPNLPHGRGTVTGLTQDNVSRENFLRSSMESAVFGLKMGLESFVKLGFRATEIRITGGGSSSPLWRQIVADVFNLPVVFPEEKESACLGAALQALWCWESGAKGGVADPGRLKAIVDQHVSLDPAKAANPGANVRVYADAYATYKKYLGALTPLFQ